MYTMTVNGKRRKVTKVQRNIIISFRLFYLLLMVVSIAFIGWVIISYFNVICNNLSPETISNIWDWNFFKVLFPAK